MPSYPSSPRTTGKNKTVPPGQRGQAAPTTVSMVGSYVTGPTAGLLFTFTFAVPVTVSGIIPVCQGISSSPGNILPPFGCIQSFSGSTTVIQLYPGISLAGPFFTPSGFPNARTVGGGLPCGSNCTV